MSRPCADGDARTIECLATVSRGHELSCPYGCYSSVLEVVDVPLSIEGKKEVVAEVHEVAKSAHSAVAAEYIGLTVAQMTELRVKARNSGVYVRVVRNTLAQIGRAHV